MPLMVREDADERSPWQHRRSPSARLDLAGTHERDAHPRRVDRMNSRAGSGTSSGLLYLGLFLILGAFIASMVDGFPPSWQVLVPVEVAMALLFALNERRTRRWHNDLLNRI